MNGVVGYQLLDDGTPLSLGLLLLSAGVLFIGTGYIAFDTGFSWTGHFDASLTAPNRNIGLYVLYLLFPLICIVGFFILEMNLVLRVLGEKKPMRLFHRRGTYGLAELTDDRIFGRLGTPVCHRADFPIRDQRSYLSVDIGQDRRCPLRNSFHSPLHRPDLDLLVEHHRRRLARTSSGGPHIRIDNTNMTTRTLSSHIIMI